MSDHTLRGPLLHPVDLLSGMLAQPPAVHDDRADALRYAMPNSMWGSVDVIVSKHIPTGGLVQHRFPRSKRRRIRKKWANNPGNHRWVAAPPTYLKHGNTVYTNPEGFAQLQRMTKPRPAPALSESITDYFLRSPR